MTDSTRRAVLGTAVCAATLAGCARYNANDGGLTGAAEPLARVRDDTVLASTAGIPAGGGVILAAKRIVITQPQAGSFGAFTAVCTHQGCIVATVSGGTINCPCHGSKFSIANGSVVHGPAIIPLAPVAIKVQGTSIVSESS
jgi:Rieske Fe-S protein